jgi:hypothetical protein
MNHLGYDDCNQQYRNWTWKARKKMQTKEREIPDLPSITSTVKMRYKVHLYSYEIV